MLKDKETLSNEVNRIVIKVGTSTLAHPNGKANIRHIKKLVSVISDIRNSGKEVALVTSGAIGIGAGKLNITKPRDTAGRQATSAIGQCELMFIYDKIFAEYGYATGQFLLTKRDVDNVECKENLINAFEKVFEYGAIPIINENDVVAIDEIVYGDNDSLSAIVARLIKADKLIILTDIDGLYDRNPEEEGATLISEVTEINDDLFAIAGGRGSTLGTGGMTTKLQAAKIATQAGIETIIINGKDPDNVYKILDGEKIGTLFVTKKSR